MSRSRHFQLFFSGILSLFLIQVHLSAAPTLDDVLNNLKIKETQVKSLELSFTQDIKFTEMTTGSSSKGKVTFLKPNKMRLQKLSPDQQTIVTDGKQVWVYNPAFSQVWKGKWKDWNSASFIPQGLIPVDGYTKDLQKNFDLTLRPSHENSEVTLKATPKNNHIDYSLEILISTVSWYPIKTFYRSSTAEIVTQFSEVKENAPVSPALFLFIPPKGTEIISLN
ncbi:MAG: LolA family protein [Elusimicrobiota bacterium]